MVTWERYRTQRTRTSGTRRVNRGQTRRTRLNATERKEVDGERNQDERRAVPGGEKTETNLSEAPEQRRRGSCHDPGGSWLAKEDEELGTGAKNHICLIKIPVELETHP
ncbi:hypothetical protein NDU88_008428 [Pleurodeles waltl]|uniref:Uncharacterized protein n=1 Tax=Pleurodeles waltl TaxID=8319 RepID=A0AAV7QNI6_PLEWA|nr:hypothetical protein NDU88_008428 [Pleurodeles waltl]